MQNIKLKPKESRKRMEYKTKKKGKNRKIKEQGQKIENSYKVYA